jgi:drug/metabolite transporter (DMT)-like permease
MPASRLRLLLAFTAVYLVWSSTYLAIRISIETMPPFLMAGARYLGAGVVMWVWARMKGAPRPTRGNWVAAIVVGALMLIGGNGSVVWAEQRVPTGLTALFSFTPMWMVVFDWLTRGLRPSGAVVAGLFCGLVGLILLIGPADLLHGHMAIDPAGAAVLFIGSFTWAAGSYYTTHGARLPRSWVMATGMQMTVGGAELLLLGLLTGEHRGFSLAAVSTASWIAFAYLMIFGSIVAYSAYVYLLRHTTPSRASTYAYINPVIAVFLGWVFLGEQMNLRVVLAAATIVVAVALIVSRRPAPAAEPPSPPPSPLEDRRQRPAPTLEGNQANV